MDQFIGVPMSLDVFSLCLESSISVISICLPDIAFVSYSELNLVSEAFFCRSCRSAARVDRFIASMPPFPTVVMSVAHAFREHRAITLSPTDSLNAMYGAAVRAVVSFCRHQLFLGSTI